jgi:NADH dehydrogenase FAD-containing subunit
VPRVLVPRNLKHGQFICASVVRVDTAAKEVHLDNGQRIPYGKS